MEFLLFLAALILLDIAANALGADTREAREALEHEGLRDHGWIGTYRSRR